MLLDIKHYLMQKRQANLQEMAYHFKLQPEVLRPMLDHWIRKGRVVCQQDQAVCNSPCGQCHLSCREVFYWQAIR